MFWLIGLGNKGDQYNNTRHNVGFMVLDQIMSSYKFSAWKSKLHSMISEGYIENEKMFLAKPQTYMNLSGEAVHAIISYYKLPPQEVSEKLIVIHDDIDLALGRVKLQIGSGDGGHNGIKSINKCIGHNHYYRLRIGIGRSDTNIADYVLSNFEPQEMQILGKVIENIGSNIDKLVKHRVMAKYSQLI